ncbi:ABC transporter substrate-binding protein [Phenylobacterium sp.]|uniref:ABC transporter substrate-binding protein n=1 Tax=Phenylobacterium sp. TaxID=1871053 RepID=UPI0035646A25
MMIVVGAAAICLGCGGEAMAAADPAASRAESLCNGVLDAVKQTKEATAQARAHNLLPVVERSFNLEAMAQFAIGAPWTTMSAREQSELVSALTRYTAARYAQEFDGFHGQRCAIDPAVTARGPDRLVKSQIIEGGDSTSVNYRLREYGGSWKVIDVFYKGVSQLATERADFAGVLRSGGAPALKAKLDDLTAKMR